MSVPKNARIFVAGHNGLVGSAIVRSLEQNGFTNLALIGRDEVDLTHQSSVSDYFEQVRPEYVYLVAGKVGGIMANNTYPADFLYQNLMIHATVIEAARATGVTKLLYLGSSCIYPRDAPQPLTEEALLTGPLEPTNEGYAVAKIAGVKMCETYRRQHGCDFIAAMPTNLYGPGDNFDLETSHVLPALIRKFHASKSESTPIVEVWGTGAAMREFLHVDDLADACLHLMNEYSDAMHINIGTGADLSIRELAETIRAVVHPDAELRFDTSKPDGTPRKRLDVSRLRETGWEPTICLQQGIEETYAWFLANINDARGMTPVESMES